MNGEWIISMTPVEGMTWTYDEVYIASKTDPNIAVVEVDMTDNPHVSKTEVDAFLSGLSKDEREARVHGKFVQIGGLVYKMFDGDKHIIDPFLPSRDYLHFAMMDHGFNNPTAWLWGAIDKDGRMFIYDEHYESGQIVSYHAQKVHEINRSHGFEPAYNVGDPSIKAVDPITGTSVQLEYQDYGISIVPGNNDVKAGINRIARLFTGINESPLLYITRNCVNLIYELPRLRWATWATRKAIFDKNKKEEQHKKNDHACDALRYGVASRPQVEDSISVPKDGNWIGAPSAVVEKDREGKFIGRRDEDLVSSRKENWDWHLGTDW
jgi:hypothetical protein